MGMSMNVRSGIASRYEDEEIRNVQIANEKNI